MPVTYEFDPDDVIAAAEVNTNFDDLENMVGGITVADLASNSGILSTNLTDRFTYPFHVVHLAPLNTVELNAVTTATTQPAHTFLPNTNTEPGTECYRQYIQLRSGKSAYLCGIWIYAQARTVRTGNANPAIWIQRNGVTLGGGPGIILAADTVYYLRNANMYDNPLTSLEHDDYLTIGLGTMSVAAADTDFAGVTVGFHFKIELGA